LARYGHSRENMETRRFRVVIPGVPIPKQSARFGVSKKTGKVVSWQPKKLTDKKESMLVGILSAKKMDAGLLDEPLYAIVTYIFPPLKGFSKKKMEEMNTDVIYKDTKPDLHDNLGKLPFDSLQGSVIKDDSRVVVYLCRKIYGDDPRTEIEIGPIDDMPEAISDLFKQRL
jgi:Holliday junction resolvase RusA-like endonuclease